MTGRKDNKPGDVNRRFGLSNRSYAKHLHVFQTLIGFDRSIDHFDWVRLINSIEFDRVRSIRSAIAFDRLRLTSPGIKQTHRTSIKLIDYNRNRWVRHDYIRNQLYPLGT